MQDSKDWWAPLRDWLITDQQGQHYRVMKNAIWLFLYLLIHADPATGEVAKTIETISAVMGIGERTIQRWLGRLKDKDYVKTKSNGRLIIIQIVNWNVISGAPNLSGQVRQNGHLRHAQNSTAEQAQSSQNLANPKQKLELTKETQKLSPIDISINNKLNIDIDKQNPLSPSLNRRPSNGHGAKSKEELLALDLATALDDLKALPLYLSYARKYPEPFLRKILGVVREIPQEKVKRSRGALFNFLVQKYGHKNKHNSGD
jgi:hypothetical protein